MLNVGTLTALVALIPTALLAGSGHFGESFNEPLFAALYGGCIVLMVLLCFWTPFAEQGRRLQGLWSLC